MATATKKSLSAPIPYGIGDAAEYLGISRARLKVLAKDGRVGKMIAGRYLFYLTDLAKFAKIPRKSGAKKKSEKKS